MHLLTRFGRSNSEKHDLESPENCIMSKLKLTKGELKNQRDSLKQFRRYLPTLQLKKQQLQIRISAAKTLFLELDARLTEMKEEISRWCGLLAHVADPADRALTHSNKNGAESGKSTAFDSSSARARFSVDLKTMIGPEKIDIEMVNVAGANVPVFKNCEFKELDIDFYNTPFWTDQGIEQLQKMISLVAEVETVKTQIRILQKELRVTTQRVNLFEKVKIPECQENIRKIGIYLGDQQANAVGVSKVAKKKVEEKTEAGLV